MLSQQQRKIIFTKPIGRGMGRGQIAKMVQMSQLNQLSHHNDLQIPVYNNGAMVGGLPTSVTLGGQLVPNVGINGVTLSGVAEVPLAANCPPHLYPQQSMSPVAACNGMPHSGVRVPIENGRHTPTTGSEAAPGSAKIRNCVNIGVYAIREDVMKCVMRYLNMPELLALERVCKRWQKVVMEVLNEQTSLAIGRVFEDFRCTNSAHWGLNADAGDIIIQEGITARIDLELLEAILRKCPNLKAISIRSGVWVDSATLTLIMSSCPFLECITCNIKCTLFASGTWEQFIAHFINIKHLSTLLLEWSNEQVQQLISAMPSLEELNFGTFGYEFPQFVHLISHQIKRFHLNLRLHNEADFLIQWLINSNVRKVSDLKLVNTLSANDFTAICNQMKNLERLDINLYELKERIPLYQLNLLKDLKIYVHTSCNLNLLFSDVQENLIHLEISDSNINADSFQALANYLPHLSQLTLIGVDVFCQCGTGNVIDDCIICQDVFWLGISAFQKLKHLKLSYINMGGSRLAQLFLANDR